MKKIKYHNFLAGFLLLMAIQACSPLISIYDAQAYQNTIDLKVDFSFLVRNSAQQEYDSQTAKIETFEKELLKAYEYEKGRFRNELTVKHYDILIAESGPIYGFFKVWKEKKTVSQFFSKEYDEEVSKSFDEILKLEKAKRTETIKLNRPTSD